MLKDLRFWNGVIKREFEDLPQCQSTQYQMGYPISKLYMLGEERVGGIYVNDDKFICFSVCLNVMSV